MMPAFGSSAAKCSFLHQLSAELWHNLTHFLSSSFLCPTLMTELSQLDLVCLALPQTCECVFKNETMNEYELEWIYSGL